MTTPSPRPTAIDLFAGAGGLSLGLEQAGFDVLAAVEYDPVHAAVHEYNFPRTRVVCADVGTLSARDLLAAAAAGHRAHTAGGDWHGEIDVIAGGPPCQGFSTIGKRLIDDKRNRLVFHFLRLVADLRPRYFVMENVPGMAAGEHSGIFEELTSEFERLGYGVSRTPQILNAADFGVPQDRRRLFVIGSRLDSVPAAYPHPTVNAAPKRPGMKRRSSRDETLPSGPTVGGAIGDLPDLDLFDELIASDSVLLPGDLVGEAEGKASTYARRLLGLQVDHLDYSYKRDFVPRLLTSSARTKHTALSISRFANTRPGDTEPTSRFYRLHSEGLCNTLRAGTGSERGAYTSPRPIHPALPRVVSVREAARLHSFPDWFRLHATKWHGFRQIGNAVAPLVGRAVGQELARALDARPQRPRAVLALGDENLLRLQMAEAADHFGADPEAIPAQRIRRREKIAA